MPDKGVNAIYKAARAVGKLEAFRFSNPPHELMGQATLNVGHHPRRAEHQLRAR